MKVHTILKSCKHQFKKSKLYFRIFVQALIETKADPQITQIDAD